MTEVYKFKVKLGELDEKIWRDIEISSMSSVAKCSKWVFSRWGVGTGD